MSGDRENKYHREDNDNKKVNNHREDKDHRKDKGFREDNDHRNDEGLGENKDLEEDKVHSENDYNYNNIDYGNYHKNHDDYHNNNESNEIDKQKGLEITGERIADMTIKELNKYFALKQPDAEVINLLKEDSRKGVQQLARRLEKKQERQDKLRQDWQQREAYCDKLRNQGYNLICGLDEAGRGPLAGPVAAGAVILPADCYLPGLDDSKKLSAAKREELAAWIQEIALDWEVVLVNSSRIDEINILQATCQAMETALKRLKIDPHYLLLDGELELSTSIPQEKVIDGDARINTIAAASILAKVTRDTLMEEYHQQYPQYNFASNKGYGTAEHIAALEKYGPSPIHRQSFAVVAKNS